MNARSSYDQKKATLLKTMKPYFRKHIKQKSYKHESRHKHAKKRLKSSAGRFLTKKEIEALKNNRDDVASEKEDEVNNKNSTTTQEKN